MMCSARNRAQIEQVRNRLVADGIQCEIRDFQVDSAPGETNSYPELWVEANTDYHTASILYASPLSLLRRGT